MFHVKHQSKKSARSVEIAGLLWLQDQSKPTRARRTGAPSIHESMAGAWGIPEFMPPFRRRIIRVNLHAPGQADVPPSHENLADA